MGKTRHELHNQCVSNGFGMDLCIYIVHVAWPNKHAFKMDFCSKPNQPYGFAVIRYTTDQFMFIRWMAQKCNLIDRLGGS